MRACVLARVIYPPNRGKAVSMGNILIGIVFIVGGLSGKLALKGTNSGPALAALGGALVLWGIFRLVKQKG
jgi:4-hydroxybenzoate polyprenyltransferase